MLMHMFFLYRWISWRCCVRAFIIFPLLNSCQTSVWLLFSWCAFELLVAAGCCIVFSWSLGKILNCWALYLVFFHGNSASQHCSRELPRPVLKLSDSLRSLSLSQSWNPVGKSCLPSVSFGYCIVAANRYVL